MSDKKEPIDHQRYFNDPEYRKEVLAERKAREENSEEPSSKYGFSSDNLRKKIITWTGAVAATLLVVVIGYVIFLFQGLPPLEKLENPDTAIATEVRSRDGVVLDKYFTENRTWVPYDQISPHVINALVATEDHRFYNHWGIDMVRTLAIPFNLMRGRVEGGSTLSQQLARNLYKEIGLKFSISRKFRE